MKKFKFWIKLLLTILSAIAGAVGASACGIGQPFAAATGFVAGTLPNIWKI